MISNLVNHMNLGIEAVTRPSFVAVNGGIAY